MIGLVEREFSVPLDHSRPDGPSISVFAREVVASGGEQRPYLVFFQGGPGSEAPRVSTSPLALGWVERALEDFRVLLLDQRGTGRSTPVGPSLPGTAAEQAEYLSHFRADSIVDDAELIRRSLGVDRWAVLGQSYGGFCVTTYLSRAPEGLSLALITGGLPALGNRIDDVYRQTYRLTIERVERHYARFPADREAVLALRSSSGVLPSGDRLTPLRVRQLGNLLGMSDGSDNLHHILELPAGSPAFLHDFEAATQFARNPIYAVLHEACWADGGTTRWSASRVLPEAYSSRPELLTGEHVLPHLFEEQAGLRPLAEAASLLAEREWPRLYDPSVLAANEVPAAAAIYLEDMYVPRATSEETAAAIRGLRAWKTNEYEHNGLRADGGRILEKLLDLARRD